MPQMVPMTQMKRRQFGSERASSVTLKLMQNLIHTPFELLRGALGVRAPNTAGVAGMMGKATPYGYDPFGPGQAWDPH